MTGPLISGRPHYPRPAAQQGLPHPRDREGLHHGFPTLQSRAATLRYRSLSVGILPNGFHGPCNGLIRHNKVAARVYR